MLWTPQPGAKPFEPLMLTVFIHLTFMCPCIANIVVSDDRPDAAVFGLFIYSLSAVLVSGMSSPIIRST